MSWKKLRLDNTTRRHEFKIVLEHSVTDIRKHFICSENFTGMEQIATKDSQFWIITGIQNFVESL